MVFLIWLKVVSCFPIRLGVEAFSPLTVCTSIVAAVNQYKALWKNDQLYIKKKTEVSNNQNQSNRTVSACSAKYFTPLHWLHTIIRRRGASILTCVNSKTSLASAQLCSVSATPSEVQPDGYSVLKTQQSSLY